MSDTPTSGSLAGFASVEEMLEHHLPAEALAEAKRVLLGFNCGEPVQPLPLPPRAASAASASGFRLSGHRFRAEPEQLRAPRLVRLALAQHAIVAPTDAPFEEQRRALHKRIESAAEVAAASGCQILCTQEAWPMPFAFCTREKRWCELAEEASEQGASTKLCLELATRHSLVIVNCILERDSKHLDTVWNTAVVVDGVNRSPAVVLGSQRKMHIPRVGDFNESTFYEPGSEAHGHRVFDLGFAKIGINICYGRHHPLSWQAFALNGAELVFNPAATIGALSEPLWAVEGRNAAIANSVFTAQVNRVGTETFPNAFTSGDGGEAHKDMGPFYGSSYVAAPDGSRCPGASRGNDEVLVAELDLNLCRQVRDHWGFSMTARLPMYAELLNRASAEGFEQQIVRSKEK